MSESQFSVSFALGHADGALVGVPWQMSVVPVVGDFVIATDPDLPLPVLERHWSGPTDVTLMLGPTASQLPLSSSEEEPT